MAQQGKSVAEPLRWPLLVQPANRDAPTTTDAKIVNGYVDREEDGDYWVFKRAGTLVNTDLPAGQGNGIVQWNGVLYSVVANTFYVGTTSTGTVDTTHRYTFNMQIGGTPKLFLKNTAAAYGYSSGTGLIKVTDPNYPATTVPGSAYLDGTMYVMDPTAQIWGSNINDFTTWNALNVIRAQIEPDQGVAIGKQLVYVIAFKQWTTEVFFDAANATGSPLSPVQGAKVNFGCVNGDSVVDVEGVLIWLAQSKGGSMVMQLDNLKATQISTRAIDRILDEMDTTSVYAWWYKHDGHKFYVLTFKNNNITLAYDFRERMWCQFTYNSGANENYYPIVSSTWSGITNLAQGELDGNIYTIDSAYFTDNGNQITFDLVTPNFDGGNKRKKYLKMIDFIGDQIPGSLLYVRNSDDDYQTWSNFRTVDLSRKRPYLKNCGTFRKRAYELRHIANTRMRLKSMDLQIDQGTL